MQILSSLGIKLPSLWISTPPPPLRTPQSFSSSSASPNQNIYQARSPSNYAAASYRYSSYGRGLVDDDNDDDDHEAYDTNHSFKEAVALFNGRDYYRCHDFLEAIWYSSQEPNRTLVHGILQCAVGFHHLFNQNHKGAMMELGEGLCKLRKMNFESGPFHQFEKEISEVLDFIYQTQLELAACSDDYCLTLDQSERSYQLLGGYAAGQRLYRLDSDPNGIMYISFCSERSYGSNEQLKIKVPLINVSEDDLTDFDA